ncbi:hypothetical protein [Thalassobius sp. I31.1]|uniref:hypothetical protein n=1 Tax=Thalassobius sp. I31.1 TaxID=2109912 RepID=UPI000D199DB6|nr:hypothetical protein [Thalassobius sp. I31.1]
MTPDISEHTARNMPTHTSRWAELRRLGKVVLICLICMGTALGAMLMMRAGYSADPGTMLHLVLLLSFVLTPGCLLWLLYQIFSTIAGPSNRSRLSQPE